MNPFLLLFTILLAIQFHAHIVSANVTARLETTGKWPAKTLKNNKGEPVVMPAGVRYAVFFKNNDKSKKTCSIKFSLTDTKGKFSLTDKKGMPIKLFDIEPVSGAPNVYMLSNKVEIGFHEIPDNAELAPGEENKHGEFIVNDTVGTLTLKLVEAKYFNKGVCGG
uniref:Putative effector protein n=1 Tax=Heterodera avenae TaxID=34510 RepID=A0A2L0VDP8_HETAV|nr:putative effector protein [Heterodera avenae]